MSLLDRIISASFAAAISLNAKRQNKPQENESEFLLPNCVLIKELIELCQAAKRSRGWWMVGKE
jgi:hypothetical protein